MSIASALAAFVFAAGLLTVTPGLDTVLVLRTWMAEGRRAAVHAVAGVQAGCLIWGSAVAIGLGAVLTAAPVAYDALRWCGAFYLLWCGARMIVKPRTALALKEDARPTPGRSAFWRGLLTNVLNPKVGLFYLSFLPQFVPPSVPAGPFMVLLTLVHVGLALIWFAILLGGAAWLRTAVMERSSLVQWLDRITGFVFVGFGLRLALERR